MKIYRKVVVMTLTINLGDEISGQNKKVLEVAAKESEASQRTETPAEMMGINNAPWSPDEQKLLEQVNNILISYCHSL